MRATARAIRLVTLTLVLAARVLARDCADPEQFAACLSNADCSCGTNPLAGTCKAGAAECIGAADGCDDTCGYVSSTAVVCRAGQCVRARPICPGDCDADTHVVVSELVTGVAVSLGAQPLAACAGMDADGDQLVMINELILAVRAALIGCAAVFEEVTQPYRLYDATVGFDALGTEVEALGAVVERAGGTFITLQTSPNSWARLYAVRSGDTLTLDGSYDYTDISIGLSGSARIRQEGSDEVIEGTLSSSGGFSMNAPTRFAMHRSATLTPERFAGTYQVTFVPSPSGASEASRATIALDVAPLGGALASESPNVLDGGAAAGMLTVSDCLVAPGGHLHCHGLYLPEEGGRAIPLNLTGVLSLGAQGAAGSGSFLTGTDPPSPPSFLYVPGTWAAVRVPG